MTNLSEPTPLHSSLVVSADEGDHGEEELEEQDEDGAAGAPPLRQVFRARLQLRQLYLQIRI